jgi:hypothetical protein
VRAGFDEGFAAEELTDAGEEKWQGKISGCEVRQTNW